jgi:hypothetical protein
MTQGTTPTFTLTLPSDSGIDLTEAAHVYFTLAQGSAIVEKSDSDLTISALSVDVYLTQADTLRFQIYSDAEIQLNWTYADGSRGCTHVKTILIDKNLHKAVIA